VILVMLASLIFMESLAEVGWRNARLRSGMERSYVV
jgi:hypothetical protein